LVPQFPTACYDGHHDNDDRNNDDYIKYIEGTSVGQDHMALPNGERHERDSDENTHERFSAAARLCVDVFLLHERRYLTMSRSEVEVEVEASPVRDGAGKSLSAAQLPRR
jgi:hypothetical protein